MEQLQEFDIKIEYIPGELNNLADLLSRNDDYLPMCSICKIARAAPQSDIKSSTKKTPKQTKTLSVDSDKHRDEEDTSSQRGGGKLTLSKQLLRTTQTKRIKY
jgi:hypothetical protein